jgi:hypothetical protein
MSEWVCGVLGAARKADAEVGGGVDGQAASSAVGQLAGMAAASLAAVGLAAAEADTDAKTAALLDVPLDAMADPKPPLARLFRVAKLLTAALLLPPLLIVATPVLLATTLLAAPLVLGTAAAAAPAFLAYVSLFNRPLLTRLRARGAAMAVTARRLPTLLAGAPRDIAFVFQLARATRQLNKRLYSSRGGYTTAEFWRETVRKHAPKPALVFEGREWSYSDLDAISARVGAWARLEAQLRPGQAVALLSSNRPEYLMTWLGLARMHVPVALLHTALRGASLRHALAQCDVQTVIFEAGTADRLEAIHSPPDSSADRPLDRPAARNSSAPSVRILTFYQLFSLPGGASEAPAPPEWALPMRLPSTAQQGWDAAPSPAPRSTDPLVFIYTSGTTGMPKVRHAPPLRYLRRSSQAGHARLRPCLIP